MTGSRGTESEPRYYGPVRYGDEASWFRTPRTFTTDLPEWDREPLPIIHSLGMC